MHRSWGRVPAGGRGPDRRPEPSEAVLGGLVLVGRTGFRVNAGWQNGTVVRQRDSCRTGTSARTVSYQRSGWAHGPSDSAAATLRPPLLPCCAPKSHDPAGRS